MKMVHVENTVPVEQFPPAVTQDRVSTDSRRRIGAAIFGSEAAVRSPGRHPRLMTLAVGVVGATIMLFRTPVPQWNVLWAEDGAVFVDGALRHNPWVILEPYSGYIHIVSRLAAAVATLVPLSVVPLAITVIAALIGGALSAAVFRFAQQRLVSPITPFAVWLLFVTLPIAGGEVANTLAGLHWYLIFAGFWALLVRSRSRATLIAQCLVVSGALLSDPVALLLLPLVVLRAFFLSGLRERVLLLIFALAAVGQTIGSVMATVVHGDRTWSQSHPTTHELFDFFTIRVVLDAAVGVRLTPHVATVGLRYSVVLVAVLALLVVAAAVSPTHRVMVALFALASLSAGGILFYLGWDNLGPVGALKLGQGDRYSVDAVLFLVSAMIVSWDAIAERLHGARPRVALLVGVLSLVMVGIPAVVDYRVWNVRSDAVPWSVALDRAAADCVAGRDRNGFAYPAIAPTWLGGPAVSCAVLLAHR